VLAISAPSETGDSIREKIEVAARFRLQGVSLWRLGLVTADMWLHLREAIILPDFVGPHEFHPDIYKPE
jgi:hypothetical protein